MGKIKNAAKSLSPLDIISLATAIPLSAATDPMRPLDKISEVLNPGAKLESPSAPPPIPTVLTDDTSVKTEEAKRRKISGRSSTVASGALSDVTTYKPTLLGQ